MAGEKYIVTGDELTGIASSIRHITGKTGQIKFKDFEAEIDAIGDDVRFFDYDGSLVAQYSAAAFAELTAMPANPSHGGLTAQGWNWTLADAQAYVAAYGFLDIGQMYITDDGDTRLYITLKSAGALSPTLRWTQTVSNGVTGNWGDGTGSETVQGTGNVSLTHEYDAPGSYVIKMTPASGCQVGLGQGGDTSALITGTGAYKGTVTMIEIGAGITAISNYAFSKFANLEIVTLPYGIKSIGNSAFNCCYGLKFACIPPGCTSIGASAFYYSFSLCAIALSNDVTTVPDSCFYYINFKRLAIPASVTSIGSSACSSCRNLRRINLPNGLLTIGKNAFQYCSSLDKVRIPETVTTLQDSAFDGCSGLTEIVIPESVSVRVGSYLFRSCTGVRKVICNGAMSASASSSGLFSACWALKEVVIGIQATGIMTSCFSGCYSLVDVVLGSNIASIAASAFSQCSALTKLTLPPSITQIGNAAFSACNGLTELHIGAETPPTLTSSSITGLPATCMIYVPAGSAEAYKAAAYWSARADYIVEESA